MWDEVDEVGCVVAPLWWPTCWGIPLVEHLSGCCVLFFCLLLVHESPEGEQRVPPAVLCGNPVV